jgi:hypothetical protein
MLWRWVKSLSTAGIRTPDRPARSLEMRTGVGKETWEHFEDLGLDEEVMVQAMLKK